MKKYFISSDIHGYFDEYMSAMKDAGFNADNADHIAIICGDLFDRGEQATETLSFFEKMFHEDRFIYIRGNHEDLLMDLVWEHDCDPFMYDYTNGTVRTVEDLSGRKIGFDPAYEIRANLRKAISLIDTSKDYWETSNYVFVHGWIPTRNGLYDPTWRNAGKKSWEGARWNNGMQLAMQGAIEPGKTIICGHWHASYGNSRKLYPDKTEAEYRKLEFSDNELFKPYKDNGIIALDACTAHTGFCNVLVLDENEL